MSMDIVAILALGKHPELITLLRCLQPIALPEDDGNCSPHALTPEQSPPMWQEGFQDDAPNLGNLLDEDHMACLGHPDYFLPQFVGEVFLPFPA